MADTALLVIDIQQDMADRITAGPDVAPYGVPDRIAALLARARAAGMPMVVKHGSSGFAGTALEACLRDLGASRLVVAGAVLGFCVSSTMRDAVARGFDVDLVGDAVLSFDLSDGRGGTIPAATVRAVHGMTLALDFAQWQSADAVVIAWNPRKRGGTAQNGSEGGAKPLNFRPAACIPPCPL